MKNKLIFILELWIGGGTEKVFSLIAQSLYKENYDIYLYVIAPVNKEKYELPKNIEFIESLKKLKKIKKQNCNAIVVNFSCGWRSAVVTRYVSKDYISWLHINPYVLKKARTSFFMIHLLKKSKHIVTVCKEQKEILENSFKFKNKITTIYNCIDLQDIEIKSQEKLDIDYKYFLMPARINLNQKDFITLIDAYNKLPKNIKNEYKLVLLGDGPDESKVKNYIEDTGLKDFVVMPGFDKNPYKWLKNATAIILSSFFEGFSVVIIEALACKTPTIISNYKTGAREVSDDNKNCLMFKIGDSDELCNYMKTIVSNQKRSIELVSNASEFIVNFDISNFSKNIKSFFAEISNE